MVVYSECAGASVNGSVGLEVIMRGDIKAPPHEPSFAGGMTPGDSPMQAELITAVPGPSKGGRAS